MTANEIIDGFMRMVFRERTNNKVFPNIHMKGFECDILELTKAGYLYEYEVKVSKADFKADAKKQSWRGNKYDLLQEGKHVNYFYYVVPENLISVDDVPEFAGLVYATEGQFGMSIKGERKTEPRVYFSVKKAAPKLSKDKIKTDTLLKLLTSTYYRFHSIRRELKLKK